MIMDLSSFGPGLGGLLSYAMDVAGIYANRNTVPTEPSSPFYPSGVRLGTPLVTSRGMKEAEMVKIGKWIAEVVRHIQKYQLPEDKKQRTKFMKEFRAEVEQDANLLKIAKDVKKMCSKFPLFAEEGSHA